MNLKEATRKFQYEYTLEKLHFFKGNKSKTAVSLGIDRKTLYNILNRTKSTFSPK